MARKNHVDYNLLHALNAKLMAEIQALRKETRREIKFLRQALIQAGHREALDDYAKKARRDNSLVPGEKGPGKR